MIRDYFSNNIKKLLSDDKWLVCQDEYKPKENLKYETNFALTNGYMCTRGAHEEGTKISIPCTYIAGVYDKSENFMRELANTPDWLGIKLYVERNFLGIEDCEILEFKRVLDMKKAILAKRVKLKDNEGRETLIEGYRFLSRKNVHRAAIKLFVTPLNYSGLMEMENIIDGTVLNFKDFPRFRVKHLNTLEVSSLNKKGCYIETATRDFNLHIGTGCSMRIYNNANKTNIIKTRRFSQFGEVALEFLDFEVKENQTVQIDKYTSIYTERDVKKEDIKINIEKEIGGFVMTGMDNELQQHIKVYEKMWDIADVGIKGDEEVEKALRFNIFHLMSTANKDDDRVSLGAKLLHGEEYGGHAYWDTEIFMLPFFAYTSPETARNLLRYRYNLLDKARENALFNGYKGAKYPWESADTGDEECPDWTIEPDGSCYRCYVAMYEHHVTADIAFGIYNYFRITNDTDFMLKYGAEILIETARFWASRCVYNAEFDRYEIKAVTGPDEWHEPVDNNCYTNYMAKWNISKGFEMLSWLKKEHFEVYEDITSRICLIQEELKSWKEVHDKLYIPFNKEDKLMEQFEGYFKLKDCVITEYDENDMPIRPEETKGMSLRKTCINKQADVVMLMFLLGDKFDEEVKKINYDYYEKRTLHRSSLSPSIFSIIGLRVNDHSMAYKYLRRSVFVDLNDHQGNTREGIHAASAGGTWQSVIHGFAGMDVDKDGILTFNPWLPEHWTEISFKIFWRGNLLKISVAKDNVNIDVLDRKDESIEVKINNEICKF
jgi:kojibiose phosphorylase